MSANILQQRARALRLHGVPRAPGTKSPTQNGFRRCCNGKKMNSYGVVSNVASKAHNSDDSKPSINSTGAGRHDAIVGRLEAMLALDFLKDAANVVLVGPNGVGKTMLRQKYSRIKHSLPDIPRFSLLPDNYSVILPRAKGCCFTEGGCDTTVRRPTRD